ncbi:alcohol dehydrogenase catalytic domain-containing protein [Dactylosporangium sp. NPDC000555]|uniref:zinc-dependent alcohol dehydrogenase n=1 Tax=Dactylosporangium sp. NPDC000555 TaxID=3154260 RepID=UPI00332EFB2B
MQHNDGLAAVLVAPNQFEFRSFPFPSVDAGAVITVEACGICGTDIEQYQGAMEEDARRTPMPAIPGHEPVGRILRIDDATSQRWGVGVGDRISARAVWGCGRCEHCLAFNPADCTSRGGTYGFTRIDRAPYLWGGFAELQYLHPLSVVVRVPDSLDAGVATLINPVACGLSWGWRVPSTTAGETVVILGAGQRGICCAVAAKLAGAKRVVITGIAQDAFKLEEARRIGVDETLVVGPDTDSVAALMDLTEGGADVIVDTTPFYNDALHVATEVARQRARIVLAGIKGDPPATNLRQDRITLKELRIMGVSTAKSEDFLAAVDVLVKEIDTFAPLHTRSYGLHEVEKALTEAAGQVPGREAIHVAIEPGLDAAGK